MVDKLKALKPGRFGIIKWSEKRYKHEEDHFRIPRMCSHGALAGRLRWKRKLFRARGRLCFQRRRQHRRDGNNRILVDGPAKHGVQSSEILFGTQGLAAL